MRSIFVAQADSNGPDQPKPPCMDVASVALDKSFFFQTYNNPTDMCLISSSNKKKCCGYSLDLHSSRKHTYLILTPLNPTFYIVKLGFKRIYNILFLLENIDCGYSLELPQWGGSNVYLQTMFWAEVWKISDFFFKNWWNFQYIWIGVFS